MEKKKKTTRKKKNSKAVQALQKNEKKYTYLFAGLFLILLLYFGYHLFLVPDSIFSKIQGTSTTIAVESKEETVDVNTISISSGLVTLTEEDILSDEEGKVASPYSIKIKNNTDSTVPYRILLREDSAMKNRCGCEGNYLSHIRYFMNQQIKRFEGNSSVILEGQLEAKEEKIVNVTLWFEENLSSEENTHFHGQFILES